MGWFDEQIKQRMKNDDAAFSDAFASLADVVMSERLARALNDNRTNTKNAVDEILKFYHVKSRELPHSIKDINDQLEYLLRPSGIMKRCVQLTGAWYKNAYGAMLAVKKEDSTPVALIPKGFSGYEFFDPQTGNIIKLNKQTAQLLDTEAICFYKPLPLKKLTPKDFRSFILSCISGYDMAGLCIAGLCAAMIGLFVPMITGIIYDRVITGGSIGLLFAAFTFLISVYVSRTLFSVVEALSADTIGNKVSHHVHTAVMMRLLSLPADFFKKKSAGEMASSISYTGQAVSAILGAVLQAGLSAALSVIFLIQMIKYGAGMVFPGMLVVFTTLLIAGIGTYAEMKQAQKIIKSSEKEEGLTYAVITGIQKIRLSGAEKRAFSKWAEAYRPVLQYKTNPPLIMKISRVLNACMPLLGMIVVYWFAVRTNTGIADYFAFNAAYGMVIGSFTAFISALQLVSQVKPMLGAVKPILEELPEISNSKTVVERLSGGIEMNHISFKYSESMPNVLDDLSLKIRPGQYVAIVGESGCGKSTLMRLMLGFEKPQRGAVYYDGRDIASLDLKSLRKHIGTVLQNERLFSGDIFSNITISVPQLTMDDAFRAAEMAGIDEDIRNMPMGMHTIISEGSGGISGGQRQRLIIARAVAAKPKILMFDEATSALDNITQRTVSEALETLKCTRIVIAHRLSTIKNCDRIVLLEDGKIAEDGSYDELIEKNGKFAALVERQRLDK